MKQILVLVISALILHNLAAFYVRHEKPPTTKRYLMKIRTSPQSNARLMMVENNQDTNNDKPTGGMKVFGLNLKDPQDWLTVFLVGVILYNGVDMIVFYINKMIKIFSTY